MTFIHYSNAFSRVMAFASCEYCCSSELVNHSEGSTCRSCCRQQSIPLYISSEEGSWEKIRQDKFENLSELGVLRDRYLISEEVAVSSQILFQQLRKCNVNLTTASLLVFVIHQSMIKHVGACYSISQLSSLLAVGISPNILIKHYVKLWEKLPNLFKFSPFHPKQYIPLHMLFTCSRIRKGIFITAYKLQRKSGYILQLATCVFVVIKNRTVIDVDEEVLDFICDFPKKKHVTYGETL